MSKILVSYFSATGTTKKVAETISSVLNADLVEIEPSIKYTTEDLNWNDSNSRSSIEMRDGIKPDIKNEEINMGLYDTIIIGFPVWWYKAPTIINSFIETNNFDNKKVYVFVTSGSSTVDGSFEHLKNEYPSINFISGKRFAPNPSNDEIINWIN